MDVTVWIAAVFSIRVDISVEITAAYAKRVDVTVYITVSIMMLFQMWLIGLLYYIQVLAFQISTDQWVTKWF